jgi:hypothetical protein
MNKYYLLLLIIISVLNSDKTFLIYFSYYPSELDESFSFI